MNETLTLKNRMTGQRETIKQYDLEMLDWGFHFFTFSELDAYKAAYLYRNNPHGTRVEFANGCGRWMVTVFNETAKAAGIDTGK